MAEGGQLVCVFAGTASAVKKVLPYGKGVMGRANIDYSDQSPSKATLLKIIGNTFILNMIETLSEGHTLAEKSGLGNECLHEFIETMFPGPYTAYSTRMMGGDYYNREEVCELRICLVYGTITLSIAGFRSRPCSERCKARNVFGKVFRHQIESC